MKLQPYRKPKLPGRNDKCPCGSGKKAKKCCLPGIKQFAALPPHIREQIIVNRILGQRPTGPSVLNFTGGTITTEDGNATTHK